MTKYKCDTCEDKGWIETTVYCSAKVEDGTDQIEKCDNCNIFVDDNTAKNYVLNYLDNRKSNFN
ncbi:hypothetical protein SAMN05443549_107106 [Flavobacterium fluvii]|uniref:Uncharacterized protein n=1 Tax=Flavobacterium fluvii TaxID=468056 RepID=A0A1M5N4F2_9FLAO|nr:hypothetical protein [Flavobacterium fluvii]SHG84440.1 hypothetical protein SAMN05443549_107106 [Flavobacterium fluvii]